MKNLEIFDKIKGETIWFICHFMDKHGTHNTIYLTQSPQGKYKVHRIWNTRDKIEFWRIKKDTRGQAFKAMLKKIFKTQHKSHL